MNTDGNDETGSHPGSKRTEREVLNEILQWSAGRLDIRIWRTNTGVFSSVDTNRVVRVGLPGSADLSGIVRGGKRIEIECKSTKGVQRKEQVAFQRMIERFGGIYVLARSAADVEAALGIVP